MLHFTDYISVKVVDVDVENSASYYAVTNNGVDSNFEDIDEASEFVSCLMSPRSPYDIWNAEDIKTLILANIQ
tara:strand:- start:61 stop:279 length:219 start_codon:yes stop_codon:yes gene_type:complete